MLKFQHKVVATTNIVNWLHWTCCTVIHSYILQILRDTLKLWFHWKCLLLIWQLWEKPLHLAWNTENDRKTTCTNWCYYVEVYIHWHFLSTEWQSNANTACLLLLILPYSVPIHKYYKFLIFTYITKHKIHYFYTVYMKLEYFGNVKKNNCITHLIMRV